MTELQRSLAYWYAAQETAFTIYYFVGFLREVTGRTYASRQDLHFAVTSHWNLSIVHTEQLQGLIG